MKKKHIDVIVKYFIPVRAGIETNVLETYSALVRKGWDVTIHTSTDTYLKKNRLPSFENIRGLRVKRYPYRWGLFFPEINYDKTDLVCMHNFDLMLFLPVLIYCSTLKLIGNKKFGLVLTPHGGYNPELRTFSPISAIVKWIYLRTLGAWLVNYVVDAVRAVSQWDQVEMIKKGVMSAKITTISNGLEAEAFLAIDSLASMRVKKLVKKFGRYIIQIGRVYEIKNYETTILSLPLTPRDVKYLVVGPTRDERYKQKLVRLAKENGVQDRVYFLGVVEGIDKYYLIKHSQMMVHMALYESFGNVIHEGLSQGKVCIVANNTAMPILVKNGVNGFVVETNDSHELASKINYVLENQKSKEVELIRKTNLKDWRKTSWRDVANRMEKLYLSI